MKRYIIGLLFITICLLTSQCVAAKIAKCGETFSSKTFQLDSPELPPRECIYHIKAYSKKVCQLRIDFDMTLAEPSLSVDNKASLADTMSYVKCAHDVFKVKDIELCGTEAKQHIYVPFNRTDGETNTKIVINTAARNSNTVQLPTPTWKIRVTQLECASPADSYLLAPADCLQYFPDERGTFKSFNYNENRGAYPGKLNYAICFRRETRTKGLELTADVFQLDGEQNSSSSLDNQVDSSCKNEDYLSISQGVIVKDNVRANTFCRKSIDGKTVRTEERGPLKINFNSRGDKLQQNTGFYFKYKLVN